MVDVQALKYERISEIVKVLKSENSFPVDLKKVGRELQVSLLPIDFEDIRIEGEKIICAFVTNENGNSCIFYSANFLEDDEFVGGRLRIIQAFSKYIVTGDNNFFITRSTKFSNREESLTYEMLMPKSQVEDVLNQLILPTTFTLAKIFHVSQSFVKSRLDKMYVNKKIQGYHD